MSLFHIARFLVEVASHSDVNKMTAVNLATVFVQSFLRPEIDDPVLQMSTASNRTMVTLELINRCEQLFKMEYMSAGSMILVDDLLGLESNDDDGAASTSSSARHTYICDDLLGLDFSQLGLDFTRNSFLKQQSAPTPVQRRLNSRPESTASTDSTTNGIRDSTDQSNADSSDEGSVSAMRLRFENKEDSHVRRNMRRYRTDEIRSLTFERESPLPMVLTETDIASTAAEKDVSSTSTTSRQVTMPSAPPRKPRLVLASTASSSPGLLPKPRVKPMLVQTPSETEDGVANDDATAVRALVDTDLSQFATTADWKIHVERLNAELAIRQQLIDDLGVRMCQFEESHERQLESWMTRMEQDKMKLVHVLARCDQAETLIKKYVDMYGLLEL